MICTFKPIFLRVLLAGTKTGSQLLYPSTLVQLPTTNSAVVNKLSETVLKEKLIPGFTPPRKYTGEYCMSTTNSTIRPLYLIFELIGVEYLFSQTGEVLQDISRAPEDEGGETAEEGTAVFDEEEDEGFQVQQHLTMFVQFP
jgi:hypothetical protein